MSMNFGRELSLLRVRFTEAGSREVAERRRQELGSAASFLGADPREITAAADELVTTYPQMGRAQMTAFVRTLWQSNVHELMAVGTRILAARAALLEPHDLTFVEGLLRKCDAEPLAETLAADVLGVLATRNKKLWKDLRRLADHADARMRRAAVRACRAPLLADETVFDRFRELAEPLLDGGDAAVLEVLDDVLADVAAVHSEAVRELAERHGRKIRLPKRKAVKAKAGPAAKAAGPAKKSAAKTPAAKTKKKTAKKAVRKGG